jgi:hypothetical protein
MIIIVGIPVSELPSYASNNNNNNISSRKTHHPIKVGRAQFARDRPSSRNERHDIEG